jgi:hypothetical protein
LETRKDGQKLVHFRISIVSHIKNQNDEISSWHSRVTGVLKVKLLPQLRPLLLMNNLSKNRFSKKANQSQNLTRLSLSSVNRISTFDRLLFKTEGRY